MRLVKMGILLAILACAALLAHADAADAPKAAAETTPNITGTAAPASDITGTAAPAPDSSTTSKDARPGDIVVLTLKSGTRLVGRIVGEDGATVRFATLEGFEVHVPKASIQSKATQREDADDEDEGGAGQRHSDPNYSRLMFSPTGRPLEKGHGTFSDYYVLFPSLSYGITNNISISGGMSFIPGIGVGEQLFYVAPRVGAQFSDNFALSGGVLYATAGLDSDESLSGGIAFAVATVGKPDLSLTAGFGYAFTKAEFDSEWQESPLIMLGGSARLSDHIALVSENWFFLDGETRFSEQPLALAARFIGDRLSADVGIVFNSAILEEGLPVPWLSFSYHFGR
jgi:hypothetical protein